MTYKTRIPHNVPDLAMMCRKLERDLRKCEAGAAVMREAHKKIAELDRDAEYQSFKLTRFQAAQLSRAALATNAGRELLAEVDRLRQELALAKRPVIVDTFAAWKEANK